MTSPTMIGLLERKRELETKHKYAFERYVDAGIEMRSAEQIISESQREMLALEFAIQKAKSEEKASEKLWF